MPTYAYRCADCGHAFDIQQSFSDDALTVCPECGGTLRKVFSAVGVVFKGSGFYRNDSRSSSSGSKSSTSTTTTSTSKGSESSTTSTSGSSSTTSSTSSSSSSSGSSSSGTSSTSKAAS
ncbi:FmdB family zinc ribbon protein [Luteimicrobium sp. NPDC057192]|uniref:FmdB family zinc ribbon protein n=1 Tax=Luteimicrobium sp. NPDC057192 TaxID=3346042 RepID=UPI0036408C96